MTVIVYVDSPTAPIQLGGHALPRWRRQAPPDSGRHRRREHTGRNRERSGQRAAIAPSRNRTALKHGNPRSNTPEAALRLAKPTRRYKPTMF
jgi:hypothetical protein